MCRRKKGSVMLVDDVESEVDILVDALGKDYEIYVASDGESALELAARVLPDLILLDVLMPGMDGYEVCRRLKADPATKDISIIFVTVLGEEGHEAAGLSLGALDYISKPFNRDITLARVRNHMALIEGVRLRDEVNRIMHHDMRNAMSRIVGYPELLLAEGGLTPLQRSRVEKIQSAGYTLLNMINLGIQMYKMECGGYDYRPALVDLVPVVHHVLEDVGAKCAEKEIVFRLFLSGASLSPGDRFNVLCEDLLVYSMLTNLVLNAAEASDTNGVVTIDMRVGEEAIISIHNSGVVPEEVKDCFFEKYVTSGKVKGTGLGTYSAMLMARTHGGTIDMRTSEKEGTTVSVRLPI